MQQGGFFFLIELFSALALHSVQMMMNPIHITITIIRVIIYCNEGQPSCPRSLHIILAKKKWCNTAIGTDGKINSAKLTSVIGSHLSFRVMISLSVNMKVQCASFCVLFESCCCFKCTPQLWLCKYLTSL